MNSFCEPGFWDQYNSLPEGVRTLADRCFAEWLQDQSRPSLEFKRVKGTKDWWSVRIGLRYRALCIRVNDDCNWFFIGSHADYDALIP